MANVVLKGYKVTEYDFANKHDGAKEIKLTHKVNYNVKYSKTNICVGRIEATSYDKDNPQIFGVRIVIEGTFTYNTDIEKEKIHVESFKELYPIAKAIVTTNTASAGIPPIILPPYDIENHGIIRYDKND
ncbi:MAG: hypothetical protein MJ121_06015 [Clostridia bacterium]|nr:hypothetical protein [Clostridia bacterium]